MKKSIAAVIMVFAMLAVQANGNGEAVSPKSTNYKDVISQIEYPQECRVNGVEGLVLVTVQVDENGMVTGHTFNKYPCVNLKGAVEKVINDLNFVPAKDKNGNDIKGKVVVPVNFKLTI